MTAGEVMKAVSDAGLTFTVAGTKLRVRGGTPEARSRLAPMIAPVARDIATLLRPCVTGPASCPNHGYIHGRLEVPPPCAGCGAANVTLMLVDNDGDRLCSSCLAGRRSARCRHVGGSPPARGKATPKGADHVV